MLERDRVSKDVPITYPIFINGPVTSRAGPPRGTRNELGPELTFVGGTYGG